MPLFEKGNRVAVGWPAKTKHPGFTDLHRQHLSEGARRRWAATTVEDRFMLRVNQQDGHWMWCGCVERGYGRYGARGALAHRVSYELFVGPLGADQVLHHTCRVKLCVKPAHLVAMSKVEHGTIHGKESGA